MVNRVPQKQFVLSPYISGLPLLPFPLHARQTIASGPIDRVFSFQS